MELTKVREISRRIVQARNEIAEMERAASQPSTSQMSGVPSGGGYGDSVGAKVSEIVDKQAELIVMLSLREDAARDVANYIKTHEKRPFPLRAWLMYYVECLSWREVAETVGISQKLLREEAKIFEISARAQTK